MRCSLIIKLVLGVALLVSSPALALDLEREKEPGTQPWWAPDFVRAQFAGDFGMVSAGPGYAFLDRHLAADLSYGFTPLFDSATVHQFNLEAAFDPLHLNLGGRVELHPLRAGAFVTAFAGRDFWSTAPAHYGYDVNTRIIGGPSLGSSVFVNTTHRGLLDAVDVYWRGSVHNLALRTARENGDAIELPNVLSLGFGLRLYL